MRPLLVLCALLAVPAVAQNLDVSSASYVGGSGDDAMEGVAIRPDGRVVVVGTAANVPGVSTVDVAGGGAGVVLTLAADGRTVTGAVRVGTAVTDVEAAPDGRVVVAARGVGPVVLDGASVSWRAQLPGVVRVSMAADGTVAALTTEKEIVVYDAAGMELGRRTFTDSFVEDVAVDAASGLVFVTGFNNKNTGQEPIQVAFIRAFPRDMGGIVWRDYDWPGSVGRAEQNPNVADSRGYRVSMGRDGMLYFAGESHGGNTTFFYDPQVVDARLGDDRRIRYDRFTDAFNTSSSPVTVVGRFVPATGALETIQLVLTRLSSGRGNTIRPRGIAADADGRVFVTGAANASIDGRGDGLTVGGQAVAPYGGAEAFLLAVAPDFRSREAWAVFTDAGTGTHNSAGTGIDARDGAFALAAVARNAESAFVTVEPFQAVRGAGEDGYVVVRPGRTVGAEAGGTEARPMVSVLGSPSSTSVAVRLGTPVQRLDLVDARGRVVRVLDAARLDARLDVRGLAPGPYWVRAVGDAGRAVAPLTVVR